MKKIISLFLLTTFTVLVSGCSSKPKTIGQEDYSEGSQAVGAAYRADAMHIRRAMPSRPADWKPLDFFFKHCTEIGERTHYSKTSYECSGPW